MEIQIFGAAISCCGAILCEDFYVTLGNTFLTGHKTKGGITRPWVESSHVLSVYCRKRYRDVMPAGLHLTLHTH